MAEDYGDKTEAPTPRRRIEAREQGNIARSPDLTAAVLILGAMFMLSWYGGGLVKALETLMAEMLSGDVLRNLDTNTILATAINALRIVGRAMAPLLLGAMLVAILANIAQVGLFFNLKRLQPHLSALNPTRGFSRLFSKGNGLVQLAMSLAKLILVTLVAYYAILNRMEQIIATQGLDRMQIFALGASVVYAVAVRIGVVLLILAFIDYAWQRWRREQQLKMTKQEVKEEMRRMEGDPQIKQRRKQIALQRIRQRIEKDVPTADVVVTNPTHFAIALKYDSQNMHAPKVIAKGADYVAQLIRETAIANGVPILERAPLARALYKMVEVGQEIPEQFYAAVAEILAYVYELSGKLQRVQQRRAPEPLEASLYAMATAVAVNPLFQRLQENRGMIFPAACIGLLLVILVPLHPALLDFLLVVNITISVIVLVTTIYVKSPLEFAVFPSLLLAVTLFRLVLNVATTRLILTAGDRYADPVNALHGAGEVVNAFASFVTAGSLAVGIIIFAIIFIIQFVVITKGATRISEVAARFTLDAMPGKQMAIDADLNAGVINEPEARRRREAISQEADFYGAMDGASKFVRGDAIAALIITFVNILGGLYMGMVEHGWDIWGTLKLYTQLTIGDGLVSQVPAFIVSLGAGLIVTRTSSRKDLGDEMLTQVFAKPKSLMIAAAFLAVMMTTGLPKFPMMILGACCASLAFVLTRGEQRAARLIVDEERAKATKVEPQRVEKLLDLDPMELEVGYGLVRLVDAAKGGDLLDRISLIRRQVAIELGIIVPPIRIRDNMQLGANDYIVKIKGQALARGVTYPEQFLAMDNGATSGPIPNAEATTEPAYGLPAYWITEPQRAQAELLNYTVVEATAVLATHLTEVIKSHAHELLTRQEVKNLIDNLKQRVPALVEEVLPTQIKPGELQKVMQNLLRERVPVRDLETIVETLGDWSTRTKDLDILTEYVRDALARTICKQYVDERDKLWCVTLDPAMEDLINGHIERTERGAVNTMPPQTSQMIVNQIAEKSAELTQTGRSAVVLCSPQVRGALRRMIENSLPLVAVLAYNEVSPEVAVEAVGMVGLNG